MESKRQIVNIVNFIRAVEPRSPIDLVTPVKEQIRLMTELGLRGTFLLQYDALILPEYVELMKSLDPEQFEIGVWFEVVQPLVEKAGYEWTGRFPWDWHVHCGFSMGYTKQQRERLIDILYEEFRTTFGYYPKVFGSWLFDTATVRYVSDRYGADALCNCKEQFGTDGYTLWGGYYGQGYYPSRTNVFMPAQTAEEQLPAPLFRMLGSDPVYQFDFGLDLENGADACQRVITLEPVYLDEGGGGDPAWVDWFLKENYNGDCLSFGYAQAGQENSFGWPDMKDGLTYQFKQFATLQREGKLIVEPLGETGRWFKQTYAATPASAITAHSAYDDPEKNSIWYSSKFYRVNLYCSHGVLRIRDLHVFDEKLPDPFEDAVCPGNDASYETLPVADGNRHSGNGLLGGLHLAYDDGSVPRCTGMVFEDLNNGSAKACYGPIEITLNERSIEIHADRAFVLEHRIAPNATHVPEFVSCSETALNLRYEGTEYSVSLDQGCFETPAKIRSQNNGIKLLINSKNAVS